MYRRAHAPTPPPPRLDVVVADFYGDGAPLALLLSSDSSAMALWLGEGQLSALYASDWGVLDPAPPSDKRTWRAVCAARDTQNGWGYMLPWPDV